MKDETSNEHLKAINMVVDYINLHLCDKPDIKKLSEVASISEYHFHRIFKSVIGENIGEFIVRLRLEDVAQQLRMTDSTIGDIAQSTGFSSKSALSKAFKSHFGITPSLYRIQIRDDSFFHRGIERTLETLTPVIKTIERKYLVYTRVIDWYGSPKSYARAWKSLIRFSREHQLLNDSTEFIGLCFDDPTITKPENCRFYACITIDKGFSPSGEFGTQIIEGGLFAVFLLKGSYRGLLNFYFNIYTNWLPTSEYSLRRMYAFEKYLNSPTDISEDELLTEIYIPIKRKSLCSL